MIPHTRGPWRQEGGRGRLPGWEGKKGLVFNGVGARICKMESFGVGRWCLTAIKTGFMP
jgi:hypothetical protein